jgi:transposase-like protein
MEKTSFPQTLAQAIRHFANPDTCIDFLANLRWPDGVTCPKCGSKEVSFISTRRIWKCKQKHDHRQFSAKVGTIMEDSPIPLDKWLTAMWLICNCRNGVSSYEIARDLGVTQKSAWFMAHRIRLALQRGSFSKMGGPGGEVEADEAFIGGKAKNMHNKRRMALRQERNSCLRGDTRLIGKAAVMGVLDRDQREIRATVVPSINRETLQTAILNHVAPGSAIYTDEAALYRALPKEYIHGFVNHMEKYVNGRVHTNGMENFWSLLKRGLNGTYVAVEPFHLFRYVDEQAFRYNNRQDGNGNKLNDAERFKIAASQIVGKRLTFADLTGKTQGQDRQVF